MAEHRTTPATDEKAVTRSARRTPSTFEEGRYLAPPVDIFEQDDRLIVLVDLPGVEKDDVDIRVDEGILKIRGRSSYQRPPDALHSEFDLANYHREFHLTDQVDPSKISAALKHGVLTIELPKAEKVKPREIKVEVAT